MRILVSLSFFLALSLSAAAIPSMEASTALVHRVIGWSLKSQDAKTYTAVDKVEKPEDLGAELGGLVRWAQEQHKEKDGVLAWQWDADPLWWVQSSAIQDLNVGAPRVEGDQVVVPVNYVSPSAISATRPGTTYSMQWIIGEENGNPVLVDVRRSIQSPASKDEGSTLESLRKVRADYDKRVHG